jgi:hypothetical protein
MSPRLYVALGCAWLMIRLIELQRHGLLHHHVNWHAPIEYALLVAFWPIGVGARVAALIAGTPFDRPDRD